MAKASLTGGSECTTPGLHGVECGHTLMPQLQPRLKNNVRLRKWLSCLTPYNLEKVSYHPSRPSLRLI